MVDEVTTSRLEEKAKNPGIAHRFAVFGTNMAKELGAGTLSIPGYLGDLAVLAISGQSTTWGDSMKRGIINGASWAGQKVGIEGPEILDETDKGLSVWGERVGVAASTLAGGTGLIRGGAILMTKAGAKLAAKSADDIAKAGAKAATSTADDAVKAGMKSEGTTWGEALNEAGATHSRQSLKWNKKLATHFDAAADYASSNFTPLLGKPIWVTGKYASNWLAHPWMTGGAHAAIAGIDQWATGGEVVKGAGNLIASGTKETVKFMIPDSWEPDVEEAVKKAKEESETALGYTAEGVANFGVGVATGLGVPEEEAVVLVDNVKGIVEKVATPSIVRKGITIATTGQTLQGIKEAQEASGETPDALSIASGLLTQKHDNTEAELTETLDETKEPAAGQGGQLMARARETTRKLKDEATEQFAGAPAALKQEGADLVAKGKKKIEVTGERAIAGMFPDLTKIFKDVSDYFTNMFKPLTDMTGIEGSTMLKIGMTMLAGLALGSLAGNNKGMGTLLGLVGVIGASSMLFGDDDEAGANEPAPVRERDRNPAPSPS